MTWRTVWPCAYEKAFVLEHGFLDKIVHRRDLKPFLAKTFAMLRG
ncbi:MAG: hypothetical protein R2817_08840 [Flavobacteriales bacterium]